MLQRARGFEIRWIVGSSRGLSVQVTTGPSSKGHATTTYLPYAPPVLRAAPSLGAIGRHAIQSCAHQEIQLREVGPAVVADELCEAWIFAVGGVIELGVTTYCCIFLFCLPCCIRINIKIKVLTQNSTISISTVRWMFHQYFNTEYSSGTMRQ